MYYNNSSATNGFHYIYNRIGNLRLSKDVENNLRRMTCWLIELFTPQYINAIGGYFIQGKSYENTIKLLHAAKKLEDAGVFAIVLEMVPEESAKMISENLKVPTIGIGAGKYTDGQVLVIDDLLGKYPGNTPKFVKQYANVKDIMKSAITSYNEEVKNSKFPDEEHTFYLSSEEREKLECNFIK